MVELVYKFDEKVSQSLKYDSNVFFVHNMYIWTPTPITLPRSCCACGVKSTEMRDELSITLYLQSEINFCSVRMPVNA